MINQYKISLPAFAGPLDLLLHLIERQELDVTTISLVQVTGQYLEQIEQFKENRLDHLVDFLVIGARLVLIKSRALLPQTPAVLLDEEEEEDPAEALVRQLRQYRRFKEAAAWLQAREEQGLRSYLRVAPPPRLEGQLDLSGVSAQTLMAAILAALARAEKMEESVAIAHPHRFTIEGQIERLHHRLKARQPVLFHDLLSSQPGRLEVAVTLLAVLELIKRHELEARQASLFGPIELRAVRAVANGSATTTEASASGGATATGAEPTAPLSPPGNQ